MTDFLNLLLKNKCIDSDRYNELIQYGKRDDGEMLDIILSQRGIDRDRVYDLYAKHVGLRRISKIMLKKEYSKLLPLEFARQNQVVIVGGTKAQYKLITRTKISEDKQREIEDKYNIKIKQYIATKHQVEDAIYKIYKDDIMYICLEKLEREDGERSAKTVVTTGQKIWLAVSTIIIVALLLLKWKLTLNIILLVVSLLFLVILFGQIYLVLNGVKDGKHHEIGLQDIQYDDINEDTLPIYTILVPMYRESEVIKYLVQRIEKLDYPKWKLDVRLLLEQDDKETIKTIKDMKLPEYYVMVIVPNSRPKTKPKACNYGMINAKGSLIVIYDAEDRPESKQLKMCVCAFEKLPEEYICIQGKLNFFNATENWLTKQFTIEYTALFESKLPHLMKINTPIPLGGTSNHFKKDMLEKIMLWDPYNVTEDADLGIRIFRLGYKTGIVDSITWEEANCKLHNWIRQRSRWMKGYMQTWLINMRHPIKLLKEIGLRNFVLLQAMLLERGFIGLMLPVIYIVLIAYILNLFGVIEQVFSNAVVITTLVDYLVLSIIYKLVDIKVVKNVITNKKERVSKYLDNSILRSSFYSCFYWSLYTIAGNKALWQLISRPFYWEKTVHGLTNEQK